VNSRIHLAPLQQHERCAVLRTIGRPAALIWP
jgi:hypothetical protein